MNCARSSPYFVWRWRDMTDTSSILCSIAAHAPLPRSAMEDTRYTSVGIPEVYQLYQWREKVSISLPYKCGKSPLRDDRIVVLWIPFFPRYHCHRIVGP